MSEDWLERMKEALVMGAAEELTAPQVAELIHHALEVAEARKYATAETRFTFSLAGLSVGDVAVIRKHLSELENRIVVLELAD